MTRMVLVLRSLVFVLWMYGLMIAMGLAFLPVLAGPVRWVHALTLIWMKLVFWGLRVFCGVRLKVEGLEHIPKGGALFASKHQAMVDVLWPWLYCPFPALIFKKELGYLPVFGWYALKLQNVMVDRGGHARALRKMLRRCRQLIAQGRQIFIFPEGTRTRPGQHADYKPGVAALYLHLDTPCVPVALNSGLHWPAHGLVRTPGVITVRILPPIAPGLDRETFMQTLHERIERASDELLPE